MRINKKKLYNRWRTAQSSREVAGLEAAYMNWLVIHSELMGIVNLLVPNNNEEVDDLDELEFLRAVASVYVLHYAESPQQGEKIK